MQNEQKDTIHNYDERHDSEYKEDVAEIERLMTEGEEQAEELAEELHQAVSENDQIEEHLGRSYKEQYEVMQIVRKAHQAIKNGNLEEARELISQAEQHSKNCEDAINTIENEVKRVLEQLESIKERERGLEKVEKELEAAEKNLEKHS